MDDTSRKPFITEQTKELYQELFKRGINAQLEYWDKHKHVDIAILGAKIFIEVDGMHHFTDPDQIVRDFKRNHFSDGDDFDTIHIPNIVLKDHLIEVANAITEVVKRKK